MSLLPNRLVILAPNWLGDAVMAVPSVQAIRQHYPAATLAVAARSHLAPLYEMVEAVDEVVSLERAGRLGGPLGVVRDARRLRAARFDLAILFPNSFRSAAIAWLAGIRRRCGYATDARAPLLTDAVPRVAGGHMVEYYQRLVDGLGIPPSKGLAASGLQPGTLPSARLAVPDEAREWARQTLASRGWHCGDALLGMAPGAAYGGAKQWPPERFAEVARGVAAGTQGVGSGLQAGTTRTVLVGSAGDRGACDEIARIAGDAVINLVGQTDLRQLAAVIAECRVFVSNDSGAMHLAAAVGVPVVAIFGSTNEKETAPLPLESRVGQKHAIVTADVPCRPCMLRECPIEGHPCMTGIEADRVLAAVRAIRVREGLWP